MPTTESLTGSCDRESNVYYSDLVASEEFLGSHVLRVPAAAGSGNAKDDSNVRDSRGKAKQVTTVNGRTVIVKENSVYSNKGGQNAPTKVCLHALNRMSRLQIAEPGPVAVGCLVLHTKQ